MSKLDAAKKVAQKFGKSALERAAKAGNDLQSAANPVGTARPDNVGTVAKGSALRRLAELAALPQKLGSQQLAQMAGLKPGDTSEENFVQLADLAGDKLGVPRDSTAGNAVKALAVAGAEVFADLPFNKIAKGLKGVPAIAKIADSLGAAKKVASSVPTKAIVEAEQLAAKKVAQNLDIQKAADAVRAQKDAAIKKLAEGLPTPKNTPALQKSALRPELQGKGTTEIWEDIAAKQANEPTIKLFNKPKPTQVKKDQDRFLELKGMQQAKKGGASAEDQPKLAELYKRFRGGGK